MFYAGIGSRIIPPDICDNITLLAGRLEKKGYTLRSGGAKGTDTAFAKGVVDSINKTIYRARDATEQGIAVASQYHPAWDNCNDYAQSLHGRNAMIILGYSLKTPVAFVVCWTLDESRGGTALGLSIARKQNIPVFNVKDGFEKVNHDILGD
jgi:predicted Rossmann fold nucleotide-binding protein DprA/Smf involved in DNA uptake